MSKDLHGTGLGKQSSLGRLDVSNRHGSNRCDDTGIQTYQMYCTVVNAKPTNRERGCYGSYRIVDVANVIVYNTQQPRTTKYIGEYNYRS